jgi:hypothetical protein
MRRKQHRISGVVRSCLDSSCGGLFARRLFQRAAPTFPCAVGAAHMRYHRRLDTSSKNAYISTRDVNWFVVTLCFHVVIDEHTRVLKMVSRVTKKKVSHQ